MGVDSASAAEKVVKQAARLIAAELREIDMNTNVYPTVQDLSLESCMTVVTIIVKTANSAACQG